MRFDGQLDKWNDDRGFGFIAPTRGGEPVFVHISAFPRDGRRPQPGEALTFEVEPAGDGRKRAVRVDRPGSRRPAPAVAARPGPMVRGRVRTTNRLFRGGIALAVALAIAGGGHLYGRLAERRADTAPAPAEAVRALDTQPSTGTAFRCDGRTHCSQMTSCEEATFFLRHCPDTRMDGDGDGIPCESQWCR
jgi:cold shock CspA family protein